VAAAFGIEMNNSSETSAPNPLPGDNSGEYNRRGGRALTCTDGLVSHGKSIDDHYPVCDSWHGGYRKMYKSLKSYYFNKIKNYMTGPREARDPDLCIETLKSTCRTGFVRAIHQNSDDGVCMIPAKFSWRAGEIYGGN
jgi:hypothetical protein